MASGRWYVIEQHVKLNTPDASDGVPRAWIDGRLAFEKHDVRFRTTDGLKIERVWMIVFHGGTKPTPRELTLFIDHVVIARECIAPMNLSADKNNERWWLQSR